MALIPYTMKRPLAYSDCSRLFVGMLSYRERLGFPREVARAVWELFAHAEDEEAAGFIYNTSLVLAAVRTGDDAVGMATLERYYRDWCTPDLLTEALAELARRGDIP